MCKVEKKRLRKNKLQSDMRSIRNTAVIRFFIHRIRRSGIGNPGKDVRRGRNPLVAKVQLVAAQSWCERPFPGEVHKLRTQRIAGRSRFRWAFRWAEPRFAL